MKKTIFISAREAGAAYLSVDYYRLLKDKGLDITQPFTSLHGCDSNCDVMITGEALKIKPRPCGGVIATPYQRILSRARVNKRRR